MSEPKQPPLKARLHWYKLDVFEFAVLTAMAEHDWNGNSIWPSIGRLAAYAKLSRRKTEYVIRDLIARGILSELAPASRGKRRPATYRINQEAFEEDPRMVAYAKRQLRLPGLRIPPVPGEPIPAPDMRTVCATVAHGVRICCAQYAPDSLLKSLRAEPTPKPPAAVFHDLIEQQFINAGYETQREVFVLNRGDGLSGRIDLVARRGDRIIAVECDDERPRKKSEAKLLGYPEATERLIVLRKPAPGFQQLPALEVEFPSACPRCRGSGMRPSYSKPGVFEPCECRGN